MRKAALIVQETRFEDHVDRRLGRAAKAPEADSVASGHSGRWFLTNMLQYRDLKPGYTSAMTALPIELDPAGSGGDAPSQSSLFKPHAFRIDTGPLRERP